MNATDLRRRLHARFDLHPDQADTAEIDQTLRAGVEFRGTNLWVLIFAIFIASIGLNVNSTAVIIGAMLISPLMGPIMALGYGAGINDSALMRSSLFNLGLAALLSLLTSAAYFALTPLSQAHSELLARTTPSIWDVLIAFFGGLAGIVGVTRRVKSNVIPGVAIATALMPPLCTAGYGLAVGSLQFFLGAFYLFAINCVFIAIATLAMVRLMHLPSVKVLENHSRFKRRTVVGTVVVLTLLPSLFLAVNLVQKEYFEAASQRFVQEAIRTQARILVLAQSSDFSARKIHVTLAGERLDEPAIAALQQRLPEFGIADAELVLQQSGQVMPDINAVKADILQDFMKSRQTELIERDAQIVALQRELTEASQSIAQQLPLQEIYGELSAQFPQATQLSITSGLRKPTGRTAYAPSLAAGLPFVAVQIRLSKPLSPPEVERVRQWLVVRLKLPNANSLQLEFNNTSATAPKAAKTKR